MNDQTLKLMYDYAHAVAINIAVIKKGNGSRWSDYRNFDYNKLRHRVIEDGLLFYRSDQPEDKCWIKLTNLSPKKLENSKQHKPILSGTKIADVYKNEISNNSKDIPLQSSYTYKSTNTTTVNEDYGLDIATTISNTFTAGNDNTAVKNETTFTTQVSASYHKGVGHSEDNSREITNSVTIPPMTKVIIEAETKKSNYKQKQEFWSSLTFKIEFYSHHDFLAKYDSIEDLIQAVNGKGPVDADGDVGQLNKEWSNEPIPFYAKRWLDMNKDATVHYETEVKFDKAVTGTASIKEEKL